MSMLFKRIKDWATSITAFRTGDVIPVDGPSGTAKMSKDDLLKATAENAVESGVAGSKIIQDELVKASTEGTTDLATTVDEQRRFNASGMVYENSTTKFVYSQVIKGDFVECHSPRIQGERMCLAFSTSAPVVGQRVDNVLYYNETESTSDPFVYKFIAPSNGYIIANVRNAVASANVHFLTATYCNKLNGIDEEIDEAIDKKVNPLFSDLQKTGQFTTADGYTNKTLFTGLDIKSGEKFTVRFSCDENSLTLLQLWVNNAYNQTLRNSDGQINADVVITASSDIKSVGVFIPSDRVSATSNFTMSVVSGKVKDLYIKTDELQDEIDGIAYSDQKTGQFTTADGYTNKTLFSNLKIKSGEKFVVRFNCDVDSLTMLQLWVNNAYNQTLRNRDGQINADVVLTATADITSVGILIASERVSATSNFTMILSCGSLASVVHDVETLDGKVSDCVNKIDGYGLPSYYTASWQETLIDKILDAMSCDNCFAMMFATDLHFNSNSGYSKNLMKMILDKTSVPIAVLGGDYVAAYGDSDDCDFARKKLLEFFAYVGKDKCFSVRGNHDFTVKTSAEMVTRDPNTGVTETKGYALNAITRPSCKYEPSIVSDEFYYYIDFPATKTRVMMINSCDAQVADPTASWGVYIYLTPKQIKWIAQTCLEKYGWNFVFAFHVPSDPALASYASSQDEIQKIAKAINNNEIYTYDGETYDFSATTSKVLFTVSGHGHRDGSNVLNGVLNIETTSDAYYHDDVWTRNQGTTSEQAFDVFVVDFDAGKLKAIRVGAGDDREWNI